MTDPIHNGASARHDDPATSHEAAAKLEGSGKAFTQRNICLKAVRAQPGLTAAEIADEIGMERHIPSRRLPELRAMGLVYNGEVCLCAVTGNASMTWNPAPPSSAKDKQQDLFEHKPGPRW